jgi:non-homologous end joining protein Ku
VGKTIRNTTLDLGSVSIPVALRTVTEATLPSFATRQVPNPKYKPPEAAMAMATSALSEEPAEEPGSEASLEEQFAAAAGLPYEAPPEDAEQSNHAESAEPEFLTQRGVQEGDRFYPVPSEKIEEAKEATAIKALMIDHFIPVHQIPWERASSSYYLAPTKGNSPRPLAALLRALRRTRRAGVVKFCPSSRQGVGIVVARRVGEGEDDYGLFLIRLHFAADFQQATEAVEVLRGAVVNPKVVDLTANLIASMAAPGAVLDDYEDDLIARYAELREQAKARKFGKAKKPRAEAPTAADIDALEAALEASLPAAP